MTGEQRRQTIMQLLAKSNAPLSGAALGKELGVSRQIIVQDIALLRSQGNDISSTNRGYYLGSSHSDECRRLVKVKHTSEQIEEELFLIVDMGGCIEDVMVNHRTYNQVQADLNIASRRDAREFMHQLSEGISSPLLTVTDGYHFHHISTHNEQEMEDILQALDEKGFLAELTEYEREHLA